MKASDLKNSVKTRLQNQLHVLNEVRRQQFISNAELARTFKVPASSTLRILAGLETQGVIRKSKKQKNTKNVGKPAIYFEISPDAGRVIAIDAGLLFTHFAIIDYAGNISNYKKIKTGDIVDNYAEMLAEKIKELINKSTINKEACVVALGVSGSISKGFLRTIFLPENYDLKGRLESLLDLEVHMENDANLAVIAEKHNASIYAPTSILCVLDRFEIGTGIIIDGKLYRGFNGVAGEIYRYSKGKQEEGEADILASNNFKKLFPDVSELTGIKELYRMLEEQAGQGDSTAKNLIAEIINKFTFEFIRLSRMLDPEYFIFAGEISKTGKAFQDELVDNIRRNCQNKSNFSNMPKIIFSKLGDKSVLTGAGYLGINVLSNMFLAEKTIIHKSLSQMYNLK